MNDTEVIMSTPNQGQAVAEETTTQQVEEVTTQVEPAAKAKSKTKTKVEGSTSVVVARVALYEPFMNVRLPAGIPVEVPRISNWIQCQIDAGLVEVQ